MAYCPQCGREQKCGCDVCHRCGVELVEAAAGEGGRPRTAGGAGQAEKMTAETTVSTRPGRQVPAGMPGAASRGAVGKMDAPPAPAYGASGIYPRGRAAGQRTGFEFVSRMLPLLLVLIGSAALVVTFIDMANNLHTYTIQASTTLASASARRLGYFLGAVLFSGAVRLLIAFAAAIAGLLVDPPRPFAGQRNWQRAMLAAGTLMGLVSIACLISVLCVTAPGLGHVGLAVRNLLPSLGAAVPILLTEGVALGVAGYLVVSSTAAFRLLERKENTASAEVEISEGQGLAGVKVRSEKGHWR